MSGNEERTMTSSRNLHASAHRRVLVTGGAGFIGANLVRLLLQRGMKVSVLDNLATGRREHLEGLTVDFIQGDVLDMDLVSRVVAEHDSVIHLAAQTSVVSSLENPMGDCQVNVKGTLNLLEACRTVRQRRGGESASGIGSEASDAQMHFVFASSNAVLGRQHPPATEDKAALPISPYGASKLAGEAYCLAYHGSWGIATSVLRFGNAYGPFSAHKESVVAKFYKDMLTQGQITIDGDGEQTRDFIYVGDICLGIALALESDVSGEVFQIATGVETSMIQLVEMMRELANRNAEIRHGSPRSGDIRRNYSAISKAGDLLGYEPQFRLKEGLKETYDWFSSELGNHQHKGG